jgi:hypothetical protein
VARSNINTSTLEALNADQLARALRNMMQAQALLLDALGWCSMSERTPEERAALASLQLATDHARQALREAGRDPVADGGGKVVDRG